MFVKIRKIAKILSVRDRRVWKEGLKGDRIWVLNWLGLSPDLQVTEFLNLPGPRVPAKWKQYNACLTVVLRRLNIVSTEGSCCSASPCGGCSLGP